MCELIFNEDKTHTYSIFVAQIRDNFRDIAWPVSEATLFCLLYKTVTEKNINETSVIRKTLRIVCGGSKDHTCWDVWITNLAR
jgi:hypothetical protein